MPPYSTPFSHLLMLGSGPMFGAFAVDTQVLNRSTENGDRITRQTAQAQEQINQVDKENRQLIHEYRRVLVETESLNRYNP